MLICIFYPFGFSKHVSVHLLVVWRRDMREMKQVIWEERTKGREKR